MTEPKTAKFRRFIPMSAPAEVTDYSSAMFDVAVTGKPLYLDTMDWLMPAVFVVATVVQFWAGRGIYASACTAANHRTTNMTTLVALETGVAYLYTTLVTLWPGLVDGWGCRCTCTTRRR